MIIGITIPSLLALFGGLFTYEYINDVKQRQDFVQIADDLKEDVLEVRRNEKNFLQFKDTEHLESLRNALSALSALINSISVEIIREIGQEDFSGLGKSIREYSRVMDNLYENYQQEIRVIRKVRMEGRKLEAFVSKAGHPEKLSMDFVLNLRLSEKNYMLFRDKRSLSELNKGLSELKDAVPVCHTCKTYVEAIRELFRTYGKSSLMVRNLQANGRKLEETTRKLASRERQKIASFITIVQRLLLMGLVMLCILGPLFVYHTASYIVRPIKRLADITRKISDGDLDLRAPLKEQDETYSLAISFNKMLDNLQVTQKSLAESLELLRQKQTQLVEAEKLASLGILTGGVAHELTNPLNNISMIAQTYIELYNNLTEEERIEFMKKVEGETERTKKIVQNLLSFAKPKKADRKEADINVIVLKAIDLTRNMIHISNTETKLNIQEGLPPVFIDENQIEQVIINLITNAVQAMEPGNVLAVSTRPGKEGFVEIEVRDTGKGIPPEHLTHLFDPFFSTKGVEGTGLGLSVSYGIIKKHKGNIRVESKAGEGTTFTIELPIFKGKEEKDESVQDYGY